MKKRTLTISLIVLAIMLLVGIGYASWTITRSDSATTTGSFNAYDVDDDGSLTVANDDTSVVFGKKTTPTPSGDWLDLTDANSDEDLEASFTISWSGGEEEVTLTHSFLSNGSATTVSPLLIGVPSYSFDGSHDGVTMTDHEDGTATLVFDDSTYVAYTVITIKVTYTFGTVFGSTNPYLFFNGKTASEKAFGADGSHVYNNGSLTLDQVNTALELSGAAALNVNSTYADVASKALTALYDLVQGPLTYQVVATR